MDVRIDGGSEADLAGNDGGLALGGKLVADEKLGGAGRVQEGLEGSFDGRPMPAAEIQQGSGRRRVAMEAPHVLDDFAAVRDVGSVQEKKQEVAILGIPFPAVGVWGRREQVGLLHAADDVVDEDAGHAADQQSLGEQDLVGGPVAAGAPAGHTLGSAEDAPPTGEVEARVMVHDVFFAPPLPFAGKLAAEVGDGIWKGDNHG